MRDTLIIGLLLAMPAAAILALLAGTLRRRLRQPLRQAPRGRLQVPDTVEADARLAIEPGREPATLR